MNIAYFHSMANQRRKKTITMLEGASDPLEDPHGILNIALDYYKNLFSFHPKLHVGLAENFWETSEKVSSEQNSYLDCDFSDTEVREVVFRSYVEGAPSPNGFSVFSTIPGSY